MNKVAETPEGEAGHSFDDVFDTLSSQLDDATASADAGNPPAKEDEVTPAPAAEADEGEGTPAPAADEGEGTPDPAAEADEGEGTPDPAAAPAKAAKPAPAEEEDDDKILGRLADLVSKRAPAAEKPTAEQPKPAPAAEAAEIYTDEEKQLISEYEKDYPDVAKAEQLRRRGEYRDLVNFVFSQVLEHINPLQQSVQILAERSHVGDLNAEVPDYSTVREDVIAWVDDQPTYLQTAYKHVIEQGTVEEVADLINRYKADKGTAAPTTPPKEKEAELPAKAKQAAKSLAPVSSKRSVVPKTGAPSNFDDAFEVYAGEV